MTGAGGAPGTVAPVDEQVALANTSGRVPVVFVHGLWLLGIELGPVG